MRDGFPLKLFCKDNKSSTDGTYRMRDDELLYCNEEGNDRLNESNNDHLLDIDQDVYSDTASDIVANQSAEKITTTDEREKIVANSPEKSSEPDGVFDPAEETTGVNRNCSPSVTEPEGDQNPSTCQDPNIIIDELRIEIKQIKSGMDAIKDLLNSILNEKSK